MRDRLRLSSIHLFSIMVVAAAGCEPSTPPSPPVPASPPLATFQEPSQQPPAPSATSPAEGPSGAAASTPTVAVLKAANDRVEDSTRRLIDVLNGVQDEESARAAGPEIRKIGAELAAAMEEMKAAVAALSLAGQDAEVSRFFAERNSNFDPTAPNLPDALERVVASPHGALLRGEINELLDRMLAASTSGGRRGLEQMINSKNLRR
jgi:hypothetical protein